MAQNRGVRSIPASLLLVLALTACWRQPADPPAPTARVERRRMERIVVATGTIEPEKEVEVRPRVSGIVETVHVAAGDAAQEGQPLVEIDRELIEAQVKEARARLAGSRVEARYAHIDLARAVPLRRDGTVSAQQYDEAQARAERADAAAVRDEASVDALEVELRYTTVTAPMTGTILDVDVKAGSAVAAVTSVTGGTRILTIASAGPLHLKGLVDENDVARVTVGQPARIRTEAHPGRVFEGRVSEIKPVGERQQNVTYFEVKVVAVGEDAVVLRPRMSGDADIVTEVVDDALAVPETALQYDGDRAYVETAGAAGGRRDVTIGFVDGDRVQVVAGLDPGQEVRLK